MDEIGEWEGGRRGACEEKTVGVSHPSLFLLPQRQLPQKQGRRSPRCIRRRRRIHARTLIRTRIRCTRCSRRPSTVVGIALTSTGPGPVGRVEEAHYRLLSGLSADHDVFVRMHCEGSNFLLPPANNACRAWGSQPPGGGEGEGGVRNLQKLGVPRSRRVIAGAAVSRQKPCGFANQTPRRSF